MDGQDIEFSELSKRELPELIGATVEIARELSAHNLDILDLKHWTWQYEKLPGGTSHTYIARHGGKIVGYYHIPVYDFLAGDRQLRIGQIQSVAVSPKFRGQGLFRRLADFAHEEVMRHVDLIYTFPNTRSIHTFLKYNDYRLVRSLPMFLLPLDTAKIIRSKARLFGLESVIGGIANLWGKALRKRLGGNEKPVVLNSFNADTLSIFKAFQDDHALRLVRNRDYLNWRYLETPKGEHFIIALERQGALKAVAVLKYEDLFSTRGLLVMDFACVEDPDDLIKLFSNIPGLFGAGLPHDGAFILVSGLSPALGGLKGAGFLTVPQKLVPRQLNLLTRWMRTSRDIDTADPDLWLVTLGDWDVF